ncbi:uncharacterized protein N7515_003620 [Penicillium bovifimosum]|uniref:Uncharacterized protein n=1 Tax=Penicillium bovifimosum TaxID=126998 RepID=A0A9W9H505_9EURO|nr:uncharacterized protein N7515_003620 [Penicillium bovifimosum]KAJ5138772.1 hypothetical protein N7515_003620 [Penicillium bovifimosum]
MAEMTAALLLVGINLKDLGSWDRYKILRRLNKQKKDEFLRSERVSSQLALSRAFYVIYLIGIFLSTYDHRVWKTGLPVRSAVLKPHAGELVVGWVTTSESSLLTIYLL